MKILHTADWHLGDRLGRIDRTDDLRRAVERVAGYCREHAADVLLVAGDLFSEMARPDGLRDAVRHLRETFQPFLHGGGTILAITGNHDNENFCLTLRHAMSLAAPVTDEVGAAVAPGRLYLATNPALLRLADRTGQEVQFLLMPYPTPAVYLPRDAVPRYQGPDERNRQLQAAYTDALQRLCSPPAFNPSLPAVLSAHVHVRGGEVPTLFRITEEEDVVFDDTDLPEDFAYVALGHIHRGQCLGGKPHVRYCGSIERLDLGEVSDDKGVVLVDVGPGGLRDDPKVLPLEATPIYRVELHTPLKEELARLRERYLDAGSALVRIDFTYTAGTDNLEETLRELEKVFPRWYARDWNETNALKGSLTQGEGGRGKSFEDTVRDYLREEMTVQNIDEALHRSVLARVETLLAEVANDK
jgi:exonuclease SbcD